MKRSPQSLEQALKDRVWMLATTLRPSTVRHYRYTVRLFITYLRKSFPDVRRPSQLRRDPHILGWLGYLWMQRVHGSGKPWQVSTRAGHLIRMRNLFSLLGDHADPPQPGLMLSGDIPRADCVLPRPLTPEDDARLKTELRRRTDLYSNALLLTRLTGMRIGETADLSNDCLHHLSGEQWALHVPIGKLHTERWVPVEDEVREIVARLVFLRQLQPAGPAQFLLPRPKGREVLCQHLRAKLCEVAAASGITAHIVPHQLRHTFATSLLRAGVSLPALMKLLGHKTANMTLRYVEITQQDLQREFHLATKNPRHLIPLPVAIEASTDTPNSSSVLERLTGSIRLLDLVRLQSAGGKDKPLRLLLRRLVRIRSCLEKLFSEFEGEK